MTTIRFGTDGWRALMEKDFTHDNVARLTQAFALYLLAHPDSESHPPRVAVGYDCRKHSEDYALTVTRVLLANGIGVILSDRIVPTPAVSRAVMTHHLSAGIAITASHNPAEYNGFKIKDANGSSAEVSITREVESLIDRQSVRMADEAVAREVKCDLMTDYLTRLKSYLKLEAFKNFEASILVDSMHGAGLTLIEEILKGTAVRVTTLRGNRDTTFGGVAPEPILKNAAEAERRMREGDYQAAFLTDGDADRVGALVPGGAFVSPGKILSLIILHLVEDLGKKGHVVTTLSNTQLIHQISRHLQLPLHETPVGFKHIVEMIRRYPVLAAGEESGGLAFQGYMPERDGVLSSLLLLQMMAIRKKTLKELLEDAEARFGKFHYSRTDLKFPETARPAIEKALREGQPGVIAGLAVKAGRRDDGLKFVFDGSAWLLFRLSGTEPLLRIYAEAVQEGLPQELIRGGEAWMRKQAGF